MGARNKLNILMIDTHTHLYLEEFPDGGEQAVKEALQVGVNHLILPNVDESTIESMLALHKKFPGSTSVAMGLHPTEVDDNWEEVLERMEGRISEGGFVAIGEVGIDLYWDKSKIELQLKAFQMQLELADKYKLPVIIHCREAFPETIEVISKVKPEIPFIFHSFTGNKSDLVLIRKACYPAFGINGVVTYKNAEPLRESLPLIGIENIVLETDSPYLSPVPKRGKTNSSAFLPYIRDKIAECLDLSPEETEKITDQNAKRIFGI